MTLAFWSLRQYLLTGHLIDPAAGGERSADAQSRMPESIDRIIAPVLPFVSGLIGSTEPLTDGRTGAMMRSIDSGIRDCASALRSPPAAGSIRCPVSSAA